MQLAHGIKHRPALRIGTGEREARIGTADVGNKETGWRYCGHVESRGARKAGDHSNEAARSTAHARRLGSDQARVVRTEKRRVGTEWARTCKFRRWPTK